jgi:hypothetical protein
MPRRVPITPEKEARIVARLLVNPHASLVARAEGVSFSKVWRLAERECIDLAAGRERPKDINGFRLSGGPL